MPQQLCQVCPHACCSFADVPARYPRLHGLVHIADIFCLDVRVLLAAADQLRECREQSLNAHARHLDELPADQCCPCEGDIAWVRTAVEDALPQTACGAMRHVLTAFVTLKSVRLHQFQLMFGGPD